MGDQKLTTVLSTPWAPAPRVVPEASCRLFCFPYAGGGASIYGRSTNRLPAFLDLIPVQLPGRENRLDEPPIRKLSELVEQAAQCLRPYLRPPFAFFGHSMGSLIAFELCRKLRKLKWPNPECLFVSAMRGPHLPRRHPPRYNLPKSALMQELRTLGGTPGGVFEDDELLELILPTLRADFAVCDQYEFVVERPLEIPICAFAGSDDTEAPPHVVAGWRQHTLRRFSFHVMSGGHFFINSSRQAVLDLIGSELGALSNRTTPTRSTLAPGEFDSGEPE